MEDTQKPQDQGAAADPQATPAPQAAPTPTPEATPAAPAEQPAATPAATPEAPTEAPAAEPAATPEPAPTATPTETPAPEPATTPTEAPAAEPASPATPATPATPPSGELAPEAPDGPLDAKKMYVKTFSPRLFNMAFSFAIDVNRAKQAATKKGYTVPENPLILDSGNMFWGEVLVEVENGKPEDKDLVDLSQKEVMAGATQAEIEQNAGKKATKVYTAHVGGLHGQTQTVAVF